MLLDQVRDRILEGLPGSEVVVAGDGSRMQIEVVSAAFDGLSRVKRQQLVYGCIDQLIADGSLHAVTIVTEPPETGAAPD